MAPAGTGAVMVGAAVLAGVVVRAGMAGAITAVTGIAAIADGTAPIGAIGPAENAVTVIVANAAIGPAESVAPKVAAIVKCAVGVRAPATVAA